MPAGLVSGKACPIKVGDRLVCCSELLESDSLASHPLTCELGSPSFLIRKVRVRITAPHRVWWGRGQRDPGDGTFHLMFYL